MCFLEKSFADYHTKWVWCIKFQDLARDFSFLHMGEVYVDSKKRVLHRGSVSVVIV